MATIDELMKDKKPGEVKLAHHKREDNYCFIPFYKSPQGEWYGLNNEGEHAIWSGSINCWSTVKEKKLLWHRPVMYDTSEWLLYTIPSPTKEEFMDIYNWGKSFGPWETIEEPEICE